MILARAALVAALLLQAAPAFAAGALPRVVLEDPYSAHTTDWAFAGAYWRPTADQIAEAEGGLAAYLAEAPNADAHDLPGRVDGYGRQYFGVERDGRRFLVIHAFCVADFNPADLTKALVTVADGGDCFFEVYYDVRERQFVGIAINGHG